MNGSTRLFAAVALGLATSAALAGPVEKPTPKLAFSLTDLSGATHNPAQNDRQRVRVYVFLSTECPISNGYLPTLGRFHDEIGKAKKGVELFGVVYDPSVKRSAAAKHFEEYKTRFPVLFDASGLLARALGPTHVPEAFVLDADGQLVYRGAIDNAYEDLARRRPKAEKTYFSDAVDATLAGKAVEVARTKPVGCFVEAFPAEGVRAEVTYNRDVAPIVHARCMNCHRPGQVAPFPLTNYEQVAKRGRQIVRVTSDRIMPPWIPGPSDHEFVDERWLSDRELELLKTWVATGRAEGDAADLPPAPEFAEGWRLGRPDLVVKMPEPFTVPADGPDLFQNFVIPLDLDEDKLVAAVEFHPGNKRVAHHSVLFLVSSGAARKLDEASPEPGYSNFGGPGFLPSGALGGWSVGNTPRRLPNGMGRYLKKGSDLVVQMHYHPNGKEETDQSELGIYFVDAPVAETLKQSAKLVGSIWMANYQMDIPAGANDYRRRSTYTLPKSVVMVGIVPHMHLLGKAMKVTATRPDGTETTLIDIADWNYNWQDEYYFEKPFTLPAGTELHLEAAFDNSEGNPSNPSSPPKRVTWGEETDDEMLFCFFLISSEKTEDLIHVVFDNLRHDSEQPRKAVD